MLVPIYKKAASLTPCAYIVGHLTLPSAFADLYYTKGGDENVI